MIPKKLNQLEIKHFYCEKFFTLILLYLKSVFQLIVLKSER